jgi:hypothetical protein
MGTKTGCGSVWLVFAFAAMACSNADDSNLGIEDAETTTSALFYAETGANVYYDGGTQCTADGVTMHCCAGGVRDHRTQPQYERLQVRETQSGAARRAVDSRPGRLVGEHLLWP